MLKPGWTRRNALGGGLALAALPLARAKAAAARSKWVTSWAASSQGPFPSGASVAMPDQSFAFPDPATGAQDQSFRMIVRPSVWGREVRLRFSNAFGNRPVKLDGVFAGLQLSAAAIAPGTNTEVRFGGKREVILPPGSDAWSDPVALPFAGGNPTMLAGRKLAISFHVAGSSGPMTWHAKGMQTNYLSRPNAGARGGEEEEQGFPFSTTAWFFLNAIDMRMPAATPLVVCFGDSITDGTASTLNGDDRWPDILQRRLARRYPNGVAIVDAGIGSNQVTGPDTYDPGAPFGGGPSALQRIGRDVASLSGVTTILWLEGINDLSHDRSADALIAGFRTGIASLKAQIPGVRVIGATITPSLGSKGNSGTAETDAKRQAVNAAIRSGTLFDAYVDFEQTVIDPHSGGLKPEFVPGSTIGGPGDNLHPNRAGYLAMGNSIDLDMILPKRLR